MQVVLVRHALSVDERATLGDGHRHLTEDGRRQARRLGRALRAARVAPALLLSSPLVRAIQTSELIAEAFGEGLRVEVLPELAPLGSAEAVRDAVAAVGEPVMLVGHEPHLSGIASLLAGSALPALRRAQALLIVDGAAAWTLGCDDPSPVPVTAP